MIRITITAAAFEAIAATLPSSVGVKAQRAPNGDYKGMTLLAAAMLLGATRAGAADALRAELSESRPALLDRYARSIPDMYPKAYRWAPEMEEIAEFLGDDPAARLFSRGWRRFVAVSRPIRPAAGGNRVSGRIYRQADRASLKAACGLARRSSDGSSVAAVFKYAPNDVGAFQDTAVILVLDSWLSKNAGRRVSSAIPAGAAHHGRRPQH